MENKTVKCPKCGIDVNLQEALYNELKTDFDSNLQSEVDNRTSDLTSQITTLTLKMQKHMESAGAERVKTSELEMRLQNANQDAEITFNKKLLEERKNLNIEVQNQVELSRRTIEEAANLKVQEKVDTIQQLKDQLTIAQRKASQGSMQQQGEAQELIIEDFLRTSYPLDTIDEIKKGAMGADAIQTVNTRSNSNVGTIYYESKRTKTFNNAWIDKFKHDMRAKAADVGVIVSTARPLGFERAGMVKGVWVCTLDEFKIISHMLREALIDVSSAMQTQEGKGDKMTMLYNYLTSSEFKLQIEAIIEGFSQMQEDLNSEKRALNMIWTKREKQIAKVINSTVGMYGSIKGIGGSVIQDIPQLEL
jgi:hypothetical protein